MQTCPKCNERGLSSVHIVFMVHDERIRCSKCGVCLVIPKAKKNVIVGIEYTLLLLSVAASIYFQTLIISVFVILFLAILRAIMLPNMAVAATKRPLNRLRKYRR